MRDTEQPRRPEPCESERTRLNLFVVIGGDSSPREQRNLMERPFFSLPKSVTVALRRRDAMAVLVQ